MTLTSKISKNMIAFPCQRPQKHKKKSLFIFVHSKPLVNKYYPAINCQGQPRLIIYIKFEELDPQMLYTKLQGNQPSGSGEEKF